MVKNMNSMKVIMNKSNLSFIGIGHDIIEINRIEESISKFGDRFYTKLFTQKEINYCLTKPSPAMHFAGRFAAKEALAKALGTGFGEHLKWLDIEIINDDLGKPNVTFLNELQRTYPNYLPSISISHTKLMASAFAIIHSY